MANFKTYDPSKLILSFKGVQISGYADGTFIKVTRDTKTFSDKPGAGGDVVRTRSHDKRGAVVVTLQDAAQSNDTLSNNIVQDELKGNQVGALQLTDGNGTTLVSASQAWVVAPADPEYANESGNREWTIRAAELDIFVGGFVA